jgi:hypothetical protein
MAFGTTRADRTATRIQLEGAFFPANPTCGRTKQTNERVYEKVA